jgi:hypothetical protein
MTNEEKKKALSDLADDCIKIDMQIIENSTKRLSQQSGLADYFKESIEKAKKDIKEMMLLKMKWNQQYN